MISFKRKKHSFSSRFSTAVLSFLLFISLTFTPQTIQAQSVYGLPMPGTMVQTSSYFVPTLIKGITIDATDPLKLDFIIDTGHSFFEGSELEKESQKLVRYFLAALTVPKDELWVNLSPYEGERIIPQQLSQTELGRDMLAQDYLLKQITATMMAPESDLGKKFWQKVRTQIKEKYGDVEVPANTFNKVWIMPDHASVYENGQSVYVVDATLKVLTDQDYVTLQGSSSDTTNIDNTQNGAEISSKIVKEVIIPAIEEEVNEGKNFAPIRQIYHALILAQWYKETVRENIFSNALVDQNKTSGINLEDKNAKEKIYNQYIEAYKKGVYNYIREEYDEVSQQVIPRKYFSGGELFTETEVDQASLEDISSIRVIGDSYQVGFHFFPVTQVGDKAELSSVDDFLHGTKSQNPSWKNMLDQLENIAGYVRPFDPHMIARLEKPTDMYGEWATVQLTAEDGARYDAKVYHVRVLSNNIKGPGKGGIRWTTAEDLVGNQAAGNSGDRKFKTLLGKLNKLNPTQAQVEQFIAKYITEKTMALALGMTKKPTNGLGGGKGSVFIGKIVRDNGNWVLRNHDNWSDISNQALIARRHSADLEANNKVGIDIDIPAPDVRTNPQLLSVYADEYIRRKRSEIAQEYPDLGEKLEALQVRFDNGEFSPEEVPFITEVYNEWITSQDDTPKPMPWLGVYTGKPLELGGAEGRTEATGFGVVDVMLSMFASVEDKTVAIQAFGNVGRYTALRLAQEGAKVTVISDRDIAIVKEEGFTLEEIEFLVSTVEADRNNGLNVQNWNDGLFVSGLDIDKVKAVTESPAKSTETVLFAKVDILVPAALGGDITEDNAKRVKAKWIFEAANAPVTTGAEAILIENGINIVPDVLVNAGGVLVSSVETLQVGKLGQEEDVLGRVNGKKFTVEESGNYRTKNLNLARAAMQEQRQQGDGVVSYRTAYDIAAVVAIIQERYRQIIKESKGDLFKIRETLDSGKKLATIQDRFKRTEVLKDLKEEQRKTVESVEEKIRGVFGDEINEDFDQSLANLFSWLESKTLLQPNRGMINLRTLESALLGSTRAEQAEVLNYSIDDATRHRQELARNLSDEVILQEGGDLELSREFKAFLIKKLRESDEIIISQRSESQDVQENDGATDKASLGTPVGGIDFNDVTFERQGQGINVNFGPEIIQPLFDLETDGFLPVMINISPVNNIQLLLGLEDEEAAQELQEYNLSSLN
jgi:glutamate dehydrogenase/leucine dehydrogenase